MATDTKNENDKSKSRHLDPEQARFDRDFNDIVANHEADEGKYNRAQQYYDDKFNDIVNHQQTAKNLQDQENQAAQPDSPLNEGGDESSASRNIDRVKQAEEDKGAGWRNKFSGKGRTPSEGKLPTKFAIKALAKRGPLAFLIGVFGLGGLGLSMLFSPGLLIIDFKEKINEKLNDQLAVMEDQTTHLLRKKFTGQGAVTGCTKLSLRCKFNTMSDRQLKKIEKAGIKVNSTDVTAIKGRHKIDSFEYEGKKITASNLRQELRSNPGFRAALRKGYNPKFAGFADNLFAKLSKKIGINKQKNIKGNTEEERRKSLIAAANGTASAEVNSKVSSKEENCNGGDGCVDGKRTIYIDDTTGKPISKEQYDSRLASDASFKGELDARKALADSTGAGSVAKMTLKGALTSTAMGAGAVDSACTFYTVIRVADFASRYIGMLALTRYFQAIANTGDASKEGSGDAGANEFVGNTLTKPNAVGNTATDSYGYRSAVNGEVLNLPKGENIPAESASAASVKLNEDAQKQVELDYEITKYVNGQIITDNVMSEIVKATNATGSTDEIDDFCGFVKSGWGQTIVIGAAVVGAVVAFFSGGASLGWGAALQTTVSIAAGVAFAMITPKLIDMVAGTLITGKENGNQAGNAAVSGAEGYNSQTFMARGIPVAQATDMPAYKEKTEKVLAQYAEEDRLEHSPLDPTNRNTFMGSIVSTLLPYTSKMKNAGSSVASFAALTGDTFSKLIPHTKAADDLSQYKICRIKEYQEQNVATTPFCMYRGALKQSVLDQDIEENLSYMEDNNYVEKDTETGEPKDSSNEYATYIKDCMDRSVPIGGYTEDNPDKGIKCIQGRSSPADEKKYEQFRKFYVVNSIEDGMTNGYSNATGGGGSSGGSAAATPEACKTIAANDLGQIACKAYQFDPYGYLWGGGHSGTAAAFMADFKAGKYKAGQDHILDCSGLVRMAIFEATGVDIGGIATGSYPTFSKFKEISKEESKAGDILYKDGHTEIVMSNDTAGKKWQTIGAHEATPDINKDIGEASAPYSYYTKVFRFQN